MKPERLQEINQRVEYLSKAGRLNYTGLFASYCKELITAVEELQAENERLRGKLTDGGGYYVGKDDILA